ncbi:hypothetical protein L6252_03460 [Candidatus Parcubacteria bacterium]|nr:hypothetical protein [Candidatus Parcubacteria bacterium]
MRGFMSFVMVFVVFFIGCQAIDQPTLNGITFGKITIEGEDSEVVATAIREALLLKGASFNEIAGTPLKGMAVWTTAQRQLPAGRAISKILVNLVVSVSTNGPEKQFSALVSGKDCFERVRIASGYVDRVEFAKGCAKEVAVIFAKQSKSLDLQPVKREEVKGNGE